MPKLNRLPRLLGRIPSYLTPTDSRCTPAWRRFGQIRATSSTNRHPYRLSSLSPAALIGCAFGGSTIIAASVLYWAPVAQAEAPPPNGTRFIRLDEVRQHGRNSERKWVMKGPRVFDITDWIAAHPGGPVILRAVGGSIDPYWDIFTIHHKPDVYEVLEDYFIGEIDPRDRVNGQIRSDDVEDPFVHDPIRDPRLIQHTRTPCNAESPKTSLDTFITPTETFYVRNHFWVPEADEETHKLTVELPDGSEKEYTLSQLKRNFQPFRITATLQCSGNRRKHMTTMARPASGLQWDVGAISNAEWTGVRLSDVLRDAGFDADDSDSEDVKHVHFIGAEAYAASIPIEKVLNSRGDVMLAYQMNGRPLPQDHGYPLRVLVPGHTAARSVKWLEKIVLSDEESQSQWQQRDYKCFGPNQPAKGVDWSAAPAIQETPVQSAITSIRDVSHSCFNEHKQLQEPGSKEAAVDVIGYAYSGGGREIVRVDISADGGRTWQQADLLPDESKGQKSWSWRLWQATVSKPPAGAEFVVKAVDDSYNTQPESYEAQWNFRGNLTTAWHRVRYGDDGPQADKS
ncbi:Sulfite oxidase [Cladophialophora carrionii]|uniref:Nitrate reductase [NADPH] n=1 Tax=Cladophialophora carrionii TaxID=86049 RepID=A0A1C1CTK3_9EURO|nr:Sulfite oxidase [Cladophialophora carrionii]